MLTYGWTKSGGFCLLTTFSGRDDRAQFGRGSVHGTGAKLRQLSGAGLMAAILDLGGCGRLAESFSSGLLGARNPLKS